MENNADKKQYSISAFCDKTDKMIAQALTAFNNKNQMPVIACIGSDIVLGDSLGPLVGTFLTKMNLPCYIYGTLNSTITAKDVTCIKKQLKLLHPNCFTIAIDAAVGEADDVGLIKAANQSLKPGLGVNKKLGAIGDCSIIGVVAEKSDKNYNLFNTTRLNLIYKMAEKIADGIEKFILETKAQNERYA